ncbi:T9SS type A sorting domain-containing protein [candidate division KSB1 bacterium]|nr:T9SS type A sorting domain-containing protein [candidate division KSB1 bacterium]RQW06039.1 MAG: T9SS C-terminal target domain-containing protein [candidate division KSB1 bacterium]
MKNLILFVSLIAFLPGELSAQIETKLTASDGGKSDELGRAVAINGNHLLVGAIEYANGTGYSCTYKFDGTDWLPEAKLTLGDEHYNDTFGSSVSIYGNYIVVGSNGYDSVVTERGAACVYKYNGDNWKREAILVASDGGGLNFFGTSVSIYGDYIAVGANMRDYTYPWGIGKVYIFKRNGADWIEEAILAAGDATWGHNFGRSVCIYKNHVLVGASMDDENGDDSGAAYIFKRDGESWTEEAKLIASDGGAGDAFGFSVAMYENYAAIGAWGDDDNGEDSGSAYIFQYDDTSWNEMAKLTPGDPVAADRFGESISINGDRVVVGALLSDGNETDAGAAFLFERVGYSWKEVKKLFASNGKTGDYFGLAVAVDGDHVLIGACRDDEISENAGAAYVYDLKILDANDITLCLPKIQAHPGDTIRVQVHVQFADHQFDAAEICFSDYRTGLQFMDIDTVGSLVGAAKWGYEINETSDGLKTAFAGAQDISGEGAFCWLRFVVVGDICTWIPITIESALFNTGTDPVITTDGSVFIKPIPFYGDVDENGLVQAHDAAFILKYLVGLIESLTCQQFYNADVTLDSTVSALDATVIMQYVVGLIDSLPYVPGPDQLIAAANVRMEDYITSDQIVEIPIHLTGCDNVLSFEGCVTYDPAHLTFMDVLWSSELGDFTIYDANANGVLRLAGAGARPYQGGEAFARVRFRMDQKSRASATIVALRQFRLNESDVQNNVAECHVALASGAQSNAASTPTTFSLEQNYPNPFNARTTIQFAVPQQTFVKLTVYDLLGREIAILVNEEVGAGVHKADFDADDIGSGLYYYRFETREFTQTRKLLVLK